MMQSKSMDKGVAATEVPDFEPEFVAGLARIFDEMMPFKRVSGLKITPLKVAGVIGRIDMRPELIGHLISKRPHGGVRLAELGGFAGVSLTRQRTDLIKRFSRLGADCLEYLGKRAEPGECRLQHIRAHESRAAALRRVYSYSRTLGHGHPKLGDRYRIASLGERRCTKLIPDETLQHLSPASVGRAHIAFWPT